MINIQTHVPKHAMETCQTAYSLTLNMFPDAKCNKLHAHEHHKATLQLQQPLTDIPDLDLAIGTGHGKGS